MNDLNLWVNLNTDFLLFFFSLSLSLFSSSLFENDVQTNSPWNLKNLLQERQHILFQTVHSGWLFMLGYIFYFVHDEKVFFKSSSCLKYIQKNLIEITKKMYTVSHWHADLFFYFITFCFVSKAFLSLGTFRQVKKFSSEEGFQSVKARNHTNFRFQSRRVWWKHY